VKVPEIKNQSVSVWGGRLKLNVQVAGNGPALVYLHPAAGLAWDPFLFRLAEHRTIYAPEFPGTSVSDRNAIHDIDDLWDVVLAYDEALGSLGLKRPEAIGQSFGGMLASELASTFPEIFSKLVLLDPAGLWKEDAPIFNWMAAPPQELFGRLFHDPACAGAQAMMTPPADPDQAIAMQAGFVWALGCTGKFLWPIPDRGLHKRLHRVKAPTLVVWGENDRLIPSAYAEEFGKRIKGSKVEIVKNCGHIPQVEKTDETYGIVSKFLGL
jgi:pimeloyl-ACP methyl ester carboxylesterase